MPPFSGRPAGLDLWQEITWVSRQLGHSSISLTVDVYDDWERKAEEDAAKRLKKGAFEV